MTPANPDALADALDAAATKALAEELFTYANQLTRMETQAGLGGKDLSVRVKEPGWLAALMRRAGSALQSRRFAALEADLQRVTAERDEARARADRIDAKLGELNAAVRECLPPVDVLVAEREAAEAALATAEARAAQLQAEVEAKDRAILLLLPFVDYAAGEGLMFVETEDGERPEMDAADIMAAVAEALGLELGSDAYLALLPKGYFAIRTALIAQAEQGGSHGR